MKKLFYFTDIHGSLDLFNTLINYCFEQEPECTIVYGGDAADRGENGYEIIKRLIENPQIIYLYGNHEDLFVKAADEIIGAYANNDERYEYLHNCNEERAKLILKEMRARGNESVGLHIYNGGASTLFSWLCDGANEEIIDNLRELPRTFSYENLDFCHAGSTYSFFKEVADAEYEGVLRPWYAENELIWNRSCIALGWETNRICIHGHTPTINLPARAYGKDKSLANIHPCAWYDMMGGKDKRGGMKIDMDTGACYTGRAFLLDCNTLEVIGFKDLNINDETNDHQISLFIKRKIFN